MRSFSLVVFVGLLAAGAALIGGYLGHTGYLPSGLVSALFAVGTVAGWFFGVLAIAMFLIATLMLMTGKLPDYWHTFLPINLGLTVLGVTFLWFRPETEVVGVWAIGALAGLLSSVVLHYSKATAWRLLPVALVALLVLSHYGRQYLNQTLMQVAFAVAFIALPTVSWLSSRYKRPNREPT